LQRYGRIITVLSIDIFVSILLLIIGILIPIFMFGYMDTIKTSYEMYMYVGSSMVGQYGTYTAPPPIPWWVWASAWAIIFLGISCLIYGIKRMLDDVLKIIIIKNEVRRLKIR